MISVKIKTVLSFLTKIFYVLDGLYVHIVKLDCEKLEYVCEICSILKEMSPMYHIILFLKLGGGSYENLL